MTIAAEDDWNAAADYRICEAEWRYGDSWEFHLVAQVGSSQWSVRMNDFPDEPLYTLFVDGREILDFNDWPGGWKDRPNPFQLD